MHMNIGYTCCAISDHLVHAFCTSELCSTRVSMKLLPHYTFLENKLAEGNARNKHRYTKAIMLNVPTILTAEKPPPPNIDHLSTNVLNSYSFTLNA